jgi:hypothetical protein
MGPNHFATVVRVSQRLVQVRIVKHHPELIYHLPISPRIGNRPLPHVWVGFATRSSPLGFHPRKRRTSTQPGRGFFFSDLL